MTRAGYDHSEIAGIVDGFPPAVDPFALALNENPFPPLPAVRSALLRSLDATNRYPEFLPVRLRHLIADHVGTADEQVVLGSGASGVALQFLQTVTRPGDRIVLSQPTFDGYPLFARFAGLTMTGVPLDPHGHNDLTALAAAADDARVVVLCRPHNPTGTLESVAAVERFLAGLPSGTFVLLDEAYVEFVDPSDRIGGPDLIRRHRNVVVLRTFSKAYGLAGLRIGYAIAAPEVADALWSRQVPFNMGTASLAAVAASYAAETQLQQRIRRINTERRYLHRLLSAMGVATTESHANFVYLSPRRQSWRELFAKTGLQVRYYPDGGARIAVGTRESTRAVLMAMRTAMGGVQMANI